MYAMLVEARLTEAWRVWLHVLKVLVVNLNNITQPLGIGRLCSHFHFMLGRWLCKKKQ